MRFARLGSQWRRRWSQMCISEKWSIVRLKPEPVVIHDLSRRQIISNPGFPWSAVFFPYIVVCRLRIWLFRKVHVSGLPLFSTRYTVLPMLRSSGYGMSWLISNKNYNTGSMWKDTSEPRESCSVYWRHFDSHFLAPEGFFSAFFMQFFLEKHFFHEKVKILFF